MACPDQLPTGAVPYRTTGAEPPHLARKPNYDYEKRKKELDRKAKKEAKREDRLQRQRDKASVEPGETPIAAPDGLVAPRVE